MNKRRSKAADAAQIKAPAGRKSRSKSRAESAEQGELVPAPPAKLGRLTKQIGYQLRRASSTFSAHWHIQFRNEQIAITPVQCGMLILIDENPGLTQIELARLLNVEGSTLWQLINRLLKFGLIHRYRSPDDQRAFAIHLSRSGKESLQRFERGLEIHQSAMLSGLSNAERAKLAELLTRVIETGSKLCEETKDASEQF